MWPRAQAFEEGLTWREDWEEWGDAIGGDSD